MKVAGPINLPSISLHSHPLHLKYPSWLIEFKWNFYSDIFCILYQFVNELWLLMEIVTFSYEGCFTYPLDHIFQFRPSFSYPLFNILFFTKRRSILFGCFLKIFPLIMSASQHSHILLISTALCSDYRRVYGNNQSKDLILVINQ